MKTALEYLAPHVFEARRPRQPLQPVVTLPDALQALEHALADAEKYRYLLMRAVRRSVVPTPETAEPRAAAVVRPLYPSVSEELRLAA